MLPAILLRVAQRVQYERSKATHAARCEPRAAPRQRAWHRFNRHWLATGVASLTKGGLHLHLLNAPPPAPALAPGTIHIRVAASLQPAKGQRPPASAWAMEVLLVAHDGTQTIGRASQLEVPSPSQPPTAREAARASRPSTLNR